MLARRRCPFLLFIAPYVLHDKFREGLRMVEEAAAVEHRKVAPLVVLLVVPLVPRELHHRQTRGLVSDCLLLAAGSTGSTSRHSFGILRKRRRDLDRHSIEHIAQRSRLPN
jgi:hypothetical protein